ncbi:MAG TPA: DUF1080 domain-containing protein [Pirellulales bacterium]|nr:DUF1080 domain-containing protein [Pirellulales bacterium]
MPYNFCRRACFILATLCFNASAPAADEQQTNNTLSPEELVEGWVLLFDGETLFGWQANNQANWRVTDGAIAVSQGDQGLLTTTSEFADYQLKLHFRADKSTNSGIFLRTPAKPTDPASDCYELNVAADDNPFPTGGFVKRQKSEGGHTTGQWQLYDITAEGGHFTVKLDGRLVLDYTDPSPVRRGFIGLQLNQGPVAFRNIKLRPLGLKDVFNGRDLSGWKEYPGTKNKSEFSVTPTGDLNVKNGPGQLETESRYGDFVLQLEAFVNGRNLNSGIFFRSIPGDWWMGYESQIHNGYSDDDRTRPLDFGTGAIYRRQKARKVVSNDFEWFYKTIVASGNHVAVWVNGQQVTDWTDNRAPNENPREGQRTEPGAIIIQGHDPTTDISFRHLRAAEMPKR